MLKWSGIKELYDVSLRLNSPLKIGDKQFSVNEEVLHFDRVEFGQIMERKSEVQAKGGYHNIPLINWEVDKETEFVVTNGVMSVTSWALLSNSQVSQKKSYSIPTNEQVQVIEDECYCYTDLKYFPNCCNKQLGAQPNPCNEPLPMGRRPELRLKPLPPSKDKWIFVYDAETGQRIEDFEIWDNRIYFNERYRRVVVDYTFSYNDGAKVIELGNRLFNGFLRLDAKMSVKDEKTGRVSTAILKMPKIKISSGLAIKLGQSYDTSVVSDFYFVAYPDENLVREKQKIIDIAFLDIELTGEYI